MKDKCVRCGKETEYEINSPVEIRRWYVEGSGQLCEKCFYELYPVASSLQSNLGVDNKTLDNEEAAAPDIPDKL